MLDKNEPQLEVTDSISIRYGDVVINISAAEGGELQGKTNEQIVKFCADLLLQTTDASSLENFLDTALSIEETLREDFGMNGLEVNLFMANWRKRLYLKTIGEQNPPVEIFRPIRAIEPSSDQDDSKDMRTEVVQEGNTVTIANVKKKNKIPITDDSRATITIPLNNSKIVSQDPNLPAIQNEFTVVEKDKN